MRMRNVLVSLLLVILNLGSVYAQTTGGDLLIESLTASPGDPVKGRSIVASRQTGLCLLCHSGPFPEERFQGNLAPDLTISAGRLTSSQLRARIIDASRFNSGTIMPTYYKAQNLQRVAPKFIGQSILNEQEIEDVVAFLVSLNKQSM
jgi:sulfur-oxidizing protein SoxX